MGQMRVDHGPIDAQLSVSEVPREQWHLLLGARRMFVRVSLPYDCRELIRFVEEGEEMYEALGYSDIREFMRRGLEIDPELVDWAIKGLRALSADEPAPLERAVQVGKLGAHGGARDVPRGEDGKFKNTAEKPQGNNHNLEEPRGTSRSYTLARLHRDTPELAEKVERGELSANAAAIEAGFRKPPPGRVEAALRAVRKMTDSEIHDFEERFNAELQRRNQA